MSERTTNSADSGNDPTLPPRQSGVPATPPVPPRKHRRIWLRVVGVLFLLLIIVVLLAPTIAGLGFVRSIVVGKVNDNLNGSVEIGNYSVGWTGGISANDVKVYDAQKNLILQVNKFSTSLSLLDAARGNLALGDTVVDVDLVRAEVGDDGQLNYAKLVKQEVKEKSSGRPKESTSKPTELPAVSGKLTINYKGAIYQGNNALVQIQPSTAVIDIIAIDQPITNDISLKYSVNNGAVGTIHIAGNASAAKNKLLDLANLSADEKLDLTDVDLKALGALLQLVSPSLKLQPEGIASGSLALKATGPDSLSAAGEFDVTKFAASGEPLKGNDRLAINQITVPIDISRSSKDGKPFIDVKHADILLGNGPGGSQLGKVTIAASAPQDALISAAALVPAVMQRALLGKEPTPESLLVNGEGNATISADLDVAALATQLPNTIDLQKGTTLAQGHLSHQTMIAISKDKAVIDTDTKLPDLQGTSDGKPIKLSPIDMAAGLSALGGSTPDLRDLSIHLSSGFLNASGGGATLSQEKLTGAFDLAKLQSEASQFVDLDTLLSPPAKTGTATTMPAAPPHVQLTGAGSFDLGTDGDLTKEGGSIKTTANLTLAAINASGIGALPPVKLDALNASVAGNLQRGAAGQAFVTGYKDLVITVATTAQNAPVLNLNASADLTLPTITAPRFEIKIDAPDMKSVQQQFGAIFPALAKLGLNITDGQIATTVDGSYDGKTVSLDKPITFATPNLTITRTDPATHQQVTLLDKENLQISAAGKVSLPQGQSGMSATLSDLSVTSSSGLFILNKTKDADFTVASNNGGGFKGNGGLAMSADLKKLNDLLQKFSGKTASANPAIGDLQSGKLDGTLTLAHADQPQTNVNFAGTITNLTVTTAQKPIENETIKLALSAISPDDFTGLTADGSIDSRFLTVKLTNAKMKLANGVASTQPVGVWDTLQQADVDLNVPDLPAVYDIMNAFSPATAAQPSAGLPSMNHDGARIFDVRQDATDTETPEEAARRRKREKKAKAAKTAPAPADAPAAPMAPLQLTSGSAAGKIHIYREVTTQTTTLNVSDFSVSKLAIARGDSRYAFAKDLDFKFAAAVKAADDSSKLSAIDQIQTIQISQLEGDLGVAKLSMPQAINISDPGDPSKINAYGTVKFDGTLGDATPLLAVLRGAPKPMPYGGTYDMSQVIRSGTAAQGKLINLTGTADVTNFQVFDDSGKAVYTEPTVAVKNDLDYIIANAEPTTAPGTRGPRAGDQAIVRSLSVDLPSSQALSIDFVGRVADPLNKRVIKGIGTDPVAKLDINYDLAKLWPIVKPLLAEDIQTKYNDLKVVGVEKRSFTLSGYFPSAKTTAESMHHLNADGGFALDELDLPQGLTITKLDLPFKMTAGVVQTAPGVTQQSTGGDTTQPIIAKTAVCNQGAVDLSGITLDMGQPSPVLGIEANHKLLQGVRINPVLANALGAGNVLFKDATQANGLIDLTVVECDKVPLGDLIARRNDANATITYSVSDLSIDGPAPQVLSSVLPLGGQGLHGGIQDGKLTLTDGVVNNDFSLNIIRYVKATSDGQPDATDTGSSTPTDSDGNQLVPVNLPMKFSGGVTLATGALKSFLVNIPQGLLPSKWASLFPNGLAVPFTGNSGHPRFDIEKAVAQNAGSSLLGGNGKGGGGGLLDGLLKKKKKKASDSDSNGQ